MRNKAVGRGGRPSRILRMEAGYKFVFVPGRCPRSLQQFLTRGVLRLVITDDGVASWCPTDNRFYRPVVNGWMFPTGLLHRVEREARANNLPCEVQDHRLPCPPSEETGISFCASLDGGPRAFAELLVTRHSGQIEVCGREDMVRAIDIYAGLYPTSRLLLISRNRAEAEAVRTALLLVRPGVGRADSDPSARPRSIDVTCSAKLSLLHTARYDSLFFLEPSVLLQQSAGYAFDDNFRQQRRFLFTLPGQRATLVEQLQIETGTGPQICSWLPLDRQRAAVKVVFAVLPTSMNRSAASITTPDSEACSRNHHLARLVAGIARQDAAMLHGYHVPPDCVTSNPGVLVLLRSVDQGRKLKQLLTAQGAVFGSEAARDTAQFADTLGFLRLATLIEARRLDWTRLGVVVRADGGTADLSAIGFPPDRMRTHGREIALIDLDDQVDDGATPSALSRCDDYQAQGFLIERPPRPPRTA